MDATADSLDAGLLRFSDGQFIGKGGFLETADGTRLNIRNELGIDNAADLGKVVIERRNGTRLRVSRRRRPARDHQPLGGDAVINDGPGLLLVVQKYPGANTPQLTKGLDEALDDMRPGLRDITIDATIFRPGDVHRDGAAQPDDGPAAGLPARRADPHRVPLPVAHGRRQPHRDPAVAAGGAARARPLRHDDQRHAAGGLRRRGRRGRRRRDHRRREHHAPVARAARRRGRAGPWRG